MSNTTDSYHENFNNLKERTSVINNCLKTENEGYKKPIQRIIVNTCSRDTKFIQDLGTNFGRMSGIMEDQNKFTGNTHKLTEKVIDSLKSKKFTV
jgi:hypothetical protein